MLNVSPRVIRQWVLPSNFWAQRTQEQQGWILAEEDGRVADRSMSSQSESPAAAAAGDDGNVIDGAVEHAECCAWDDAVSCA